MNPKKTRIRKKTRSPQSNSNPEKSSDPQESSHASETSVCDSQKTSGPQKTGSVPIPCINVAVCGRYFKQRQSKHRHEKVRGKSGSSFNCDQCSYVTTGKDSLIRHKKSCKSSRVHKCHTCNKEFPYQSVLARHQMTHQNKKHQCDHCPRSYSRMDKYRQHLLTHSRIDNDLHTCDICDKSFAQRSSLSRHHLQCSRRHDWSRASANQESSSLVIPEVFLGDIPAAYFDNASLTFVDSHGNVLSSHAPISNLGVLSEPPPVDDHDESLTDDIDFSIRPLSDPTLMSTPTIPLPSDDTMHLSPETGDNPPPLIYDDIDDDDASSTFQSTYPAPALEEPLQSMPASSDPAPRLDEEEESSNVQRRSGADRVKQHRLSWKLQSDLEDSNLDDDAKVSSIINAVNRLDLSDKLTKKLKLMQTNRKKCGRKMTSLDTRQKVWDFWHGNSIVSTITNRPPKLRTDRVPKIQDGLSFESGVSKSKNKRKVEQFVHVWRITTKTYLELYKLYVEQHPDHLVCYGNFVQLKPFYVRPASNKELAVCLCKTHTHARRTIACLLSLCESQDIDLDFTDYHSFFEHLQRNCPSVNDDATYIPWSCTPHRKCICEHQLETWNQLKEKLATNNSEVTKTIELFLNKEVEKNGEFKKCLTVERKEVNLDYIINFLEEQLPLIVHHRNLLQNYRKLYPKVVESMDTVELHVDFSENLTLQLPEEIHSMYWGSAKTNITVHSGLQKSSDGKVYHPFLSDDLAHDQAFVKISLREMLSSLDLDEGTCVIVTSDNCTAQYKSAQNFDDLNQLATEFRIIIVRIYGIAGHGKNEVDTVGGTAKIALRTAIARKMSFFNAGECVQYLNEKFASSTDPSYNIMLIPRYTVVEERLKAKKTVYPTVKGSSVFNVIVFKPDTSTIQVSPYLCACNSCLSSEYGSCSSFETVPLITGTLNEISLRSAFLKDAPNEEDDEEVSGDVNSLIVSGGIVAIAAGKGSESLWYVYVVETRVSESADCTDAAGYEIPIGEPYLVCNYLEKSGDNKKGTIFQKGKSDIIINLKSVVHPLVEMEENYKGKPDLFFLTNITYVEIHNYIQYSALTAIKF